MVYGSVQQYIDTDQNQIQALSGVSQFDKHGNKLRIVILGSSSQTPIEKIQKGIQ